MSTSSRTLGPDSLAARCHNTTSADAQLAAPISAVRVAAKEQPILSHTSDAEVRRNAHVRSSWIAGNLAQLDELQVELHARSPPYGSPTRRAMQRNANPRFFFPDDGAAPQLPPDGSSAPAGMGTLDEAAAFPKHAASDAVVDHITALLPGVKTGVARHYSDTPVTNGDGLETSQQSGENNCAVALGETSAVTQVRHVDKQAAVML